MKIVIEAIRSIPIVNAHLSIICYRRLQGKAHNSMLSVIGTARIGAHIPTYQFRIVEIIESQRPEVCCMQVLILEDAIAKVKLLSTNQHHLIQSLKRQQRNHSKSIHQAATTSLSLPPHD